MSILTLSGIFPPVPTPFGTDGALALSELTRNFVHWNGYPLAGTSCWAPTARACT